MWQSANFLKFRNRIFLAFLAHPVGKQLAICARLCNLLRASLFYQFAAFDRQCIVFLVWFYVLLNSDDQRQKFYAHLCLWLCYIDSTPYTATKLSLLQWFPHIVPNTGHSFLLALTLSNFNRFWKFFHSKKEYEICYKHCNVSHHTLSMLRYYLGISEDTTLKSYHVCKN